MNGNKKICLFAALFVLFVAVIVLAIAMATVLNGNSDDTVSVVSHWDSCVTL